MYFTCGTKSSWAPGWLSHSCSHHSNHYCFLSCYFETEDNIMDVVALMLVHGWACPNAHAKSRQHVWLSVGRHISHAALSGLFVQQSLCCQNSRSTRVLSFRISCAKESSPWFGLRNASTYHPWIFRTMYLSSVCCCWIVRVWTCVWTYVYIRAMHATE